MQIPLIHEVYYVEVGITLEGNIPNSDPNCERKFEDKCARKLLQ